MLGIGAPLAADGDMTLSYQFDATTGASNFRLHQRYINTSNSYWVELQPASTTARIYRKAAGTVTEIASFSVPSDTDPHRLRFQVAGSTVQAKVWDLGDPEPGTWNATVTDTAVTGSGRPLIYYGYGGTGAGNAVTIDDITHTNPTTPPAPLVDYAWNDDSQLTNEAMVNGATRAWTWTDGELTQFAQANTPGLGNRTTNLTYNTAGRLATETTSGVTTSYDYDQAGQLLEADRSTGTDSTWAYDDLGRRSAQAVGSNTTTYGYDDAGQLTAATPSSGTATTFSYDNAGRRTADTTGTNTTTYTYDELGRLAELELPNGDTQERGYNPDNALDTLTNDIGTDTTIEQLDWDTTNGLAELVTIAEHNTTSGSNTTTSLTRANPAAPWATSQSGRYTRDLPSDHYGSTIATTTATIGRATSYTAWGEPASGTNTLAPSLGYRGELALGDQLHLRARNYQPGLGQFTTTDPLPGVAGTPTINSPYHYTNNTPTNLVDPSGMLTRDGTFTEASCGGGAQVPLPTSSYDVLGQNPSSTHMCVVPPNTVPFFAALAGLSVGVAVGILCIPADATVILIVACNALAAQAGGATYRWLDGSSSTDPLSAGDLAVDGLLGGALGGIGSGAVSRPPAGVGDDVLRLPTPAGFGQHTSARTVTELLDSLPRGRQPHVRTVSSEADLRVVFEELTAGATPIDWAGFKGNAFLRHDGVEVGWRSFSRSGGAAVDVDFRTTPKQNITIHVDR